MTTKPLLLAVMLALPITANAAYTYNKVNTPAQVANNGTVTMAPNGPYQTITPGEHDDEHIASTKYVIGAYNDTIAAINNLDRIKQQQLLTYDDGDTYLTVNDEIMSGDGLTVSLADGPDVEDIGNYLVSAYAVAKGIKSQHVTIYTTWEDDTANGTTVVPLTTVVPED